MLCRAVAALGISELLRATETVGDLGRPGAACGPGHCQAALRRGGPGSPPAALRCRERVCAAKALDIHVLLYAAVALSIIVRLHAALALASCGRSTPPRPWLSSSSLAPPWPWACQAFLERLRAAEASRLLGLLGAAAARAILERPRGAVTLCIPGPPCADELMRAWASSSCRGAVAPLALGIFTHSTSRSAPL